MSSRLRRTGREGITTQSKCGIVVSNGSKTDIYVVSTVYYSGHGIHTGSNASFFLNRSLEKLQGSEHMLTTLR